MHRCKAPPVLTGSPRRCASPYLTRRRVSPDLARCCRVSSRPHALSPLLPPTSRAAATSPSDLLWYAPSTLLPQILGHYPDLKADVVISSLDPSPSRVRLFPRSVAAVPFPAIAPPLSISEV
ncbi:hypothetical protein LINPERPRIM_LOCUS38190 [Linum perenne]